MDLAFSLSPLKAIQGDRIRQLFAYEPPHSRRSSPRKSPSRALPNHSFRGSNQCFPPPNSNRLKFVLIHTAPKYIPLFQRAVVHVNQPDTNHQRHSKSPKVIVQRFFFEDGNVTFAIGTKNGDVVNRDSGEVPLRKIFDFVTPTELERFENQDFTEEDEREEQERLDKMLRKKAPGRPRKNPLFGDTIFREQSTLSSGLINSKRPRGRPRRNTVSAPSFNGPQPGLEVRIPIGLRASSVVADSENSSEIETTPRRLQYSMVAASGLAPPETSEEETSREVSMAGTQSPDIEPSSKKRKIESTGTLQCLAPRSTPMVRIPPDVRPKAISHPSQTSAQSRLVDLTGDETDSEDVDTIKPLSYDSPKDSSPLLGIDEKRQTLLHQFQSRDNQQNSPASSSSDSLIGSTVVQRTQKSESQSESQPSQATQKQANSTDNPFSLKGSHRPATKLPLLRNKTGESTPSTQHTPPNKSRPRKVSLTPHFPPAMTYNHNSYSPTDNRPVSSFSADSKNSSLPTRIQAPPHKRKRSPEPIESGNPTSKPSRTPVSSPLKPLQPTNYITDFFQPKYSPIKTLQLMEEEDDDESYNPIAHSSSPDSPSSEILVAQRHAQEGLEINYPTAHTHDEPSKQLTTNQSEESERDSEDDDDSVELELVSESIVRARAASSTRKPLSDAELQDTKSGDESNSDGKTGPDEDESSEEESSESDSLSSEVLVMRRS